MAITLTIDGVDQTANYNGTIALASGVVAPPPPPPVPPPVPPAGVSPEGTTIPPAAEIRTTSGDVWTLGPADGDMFHLYRNGTDHYNDGRGKELHWIGGNVYTFAGSYGWFKATATSWIASTPPGFP